jgi:hypothetical protein
VRTAASDTESLGSTNKAGKYGFGFRGLTASVGIVRSRTQAMELRVKLTALHVEAVRDFGLYFRHCLQDEMEEGCSPACKSQSGSKDECV